MTCVCTYVVQPASHIAASISGHVTSVLIGNFMVVLTSFSTLLRYRQHRLASHGGVLVLWGPRRVAPPDSRSPGGLYNDSTRRARVGALKAHARDAGAVQSKHEDLAMSTTTASAVIRRQDYTPPAFLIDSVALEFDLVPSRTVVKNTMKLRRNPDAQGDASRLELMGEQLEFVSAAIDGVAHEDVRVNENGLSIGSIPADAFELSIESICNPAENTTLSGLYVSSGNFFTQCEAEGFRRITYFLDRPDVMATYTVTLRADKTACPVLLSNGNLIEEGDLPDGRHFAKWEDPFKKPSYLFALVAGKLVCIEERIESGSGKESCCKSGSSRTISTRPVTRWIRSSTRSAGTRSASASNSIWTAS